MRVSYDQQSLNLKITLPFDPAAVGSTGHQRIERDFQGSAVALFRELLRAEKTRDHLGPHLRASADLLAFQNNRAGAGGQFAGQRAQQFVLSVAGNTANARV